MLLTKLGISSFGGGGRVCTGGYDGVGLADGAGGIGCIGCCGGGTKLGGCVAIFHHEEGYGDKVF
ncbi:MAG: hypothetical protein ACPL1Y_02590 [Thermoplasmata archaeon]